MISEIYKNRVLYYNLMKDFLQKKISPWEFRKKYWHQRNEDLDENRLSGYRDYYLDRVLLGDGKKFQEKYCQLLYEKGISVLKEYEKGAKELNIKGESFFMGLWNFIDYPVKDYYPSDDEGFDPQFDVDEQTLTEIIQAVFDVLEHNKDRWMNEEQKLDQEELSGENSQGEGT